MDKYYQRFKIEPFKHNSFAVQKKLYYNKFQTVAYVKMFPSFDWNIEYQRELSLNEKLFIENYLDKFFYNLSRLEIRKQCEGKHSVSYFIIKKYYRKVFIVAKIIIITDPFRLYLKECHISYPEIKYICNLLTSYF